MEKESIDYSKPENTVIKAGDLRNELQGSYKQRMEEEKRILIMLTPGKRPEVIFTGFWNGKLIRAAMDSIAKAYRMRRHRVSRPTPLERVANHTPTLEGADVMGKKGLNEEKSDVVQKS